MSTEVKIESAGPARKRITITVPADMVDEKLETSLQTLMTESTLPGFRKGRAPRHLIEKRFGTAVRSETKSQVIADAYSSAIEEHSIKPVGEPEPASDLESLELVAGKPMTFSVDVEVVPEFDLPEIKDLEILKPQIDISDEMVQEEVDRQCLSMGEPHDVTDGTYQADDRFRGPVRAYRGDDDDPFFSHPSGTLTYPRESEDGRGVVLGIMVDDLAKTLDAVAAGETLIIETVGPENHEREEIRGEKVRIEMDVEDVQRVEPADIETVIANYGMTNEDMLREQIRLALEQRRDQEQAAAMREQVSDFLVDAVDFELPEKLSASQVERNLRRNEMEMLYRGMDPDEVERRLAEIRSEADARTRRRLKLFFLLHRFADEYNISVNEQEINGRIATIAAQNNMRPEQLRAQFAEQGRLQEIGMQIREHKAADRIVQDCTTKNITADEWAERVKERDKKLANA